MLGSDSLTDASGRFSHDGAETELAIDLAERGVELAIEHADDRPAAGASLSLWNDDWRRGIESVATDEHGRARLFGLVVGSATLLVNDDARPLLYTLELDAARTAPLALTLPGGAIEGRVDARGGGRVGVSA